jgi:hypothetical protein
MALYLCELGVSRMSRRMSKTVTINVRQANYTANCYSLFVQFCVQFQLLLHICELFLFSFVWLP